MMESKDDKMNILLYRTNEYTFFVGTWVQMFHHDLLVELRRQNEHIQTTGSQVAGLHQGFR